VDGGLLARVPGEVHEVEGVAPELERELVLERAGRRVGRIARVPEQPHAVGVRLLRRLQPLLGRHRRDRLLVAVPDPPLRDHLDPRVVRVAQDVVGVGLGVDQVTDGAVLLHPLAPADGVDRLLGGVDHHDPVLGDDEAGVAAPRVDLRPGVRADASHG
jgi:hypothetical protein